MAQFSRRKPRSLAHYVARPLLDPNSLTLYRLVSCVFQAGNENAGQGARSTLKSPIHITPFSIRIEEEILFDLRERIRNTRWPDQAPGAAWDQGTDLNYLTQLLAYWADGFDWRAQERDLNTVDHFRATLDGVYIHLP